MVKGGSMTKVTVIDDDENILELYADYLDALGFKDISLHSDSKPFGDLEYVMDVVKDTEVIFCDIRMPDVDGKDIMDLVVEARKRLGKQVLFVFISGIPKDYYPCTSDGWGAMVKADDIIGKPITLNEMKELLDGHGIYPAKADEAIKAFDEESA